MTMPVAASRQRNGEKSMSHSNQRKLHRHKTRRRTAPGASPGTLTIDPNAPPPQMRLVVYGPDRLDETESPSLEQLPTLSEGQTVRWLNVDGLGDIDTLERIGAAFGLHPLALEDVVNVHQRPKVEAYEDHLFIIVRMPVDGPASATGDLSQQRLETEQVAICLGRDFVVTFQERPGDCFDPVRRRMQTTNGNIRLRGPDYLAYALIDAVIDAYFPLLEMYGERVEELETEVVERPQAGQIARIHELKRNLLTARRAVWPQRDMINTLLRDDSPLIDAHTRIYLRDCYDHTIQLIDMIESYREISTGLVDIHLSSISNRMNEVMKVLTIIATIFIPLTFVVGVYGMNFDPAAGPLNMPELGWSYGYPAVMLFMATIAAGLVLWFRRKGWIGRNRL